MDHVTPKQAWAALLTDPEARLVDVRTEAEWHHVGLPDLRATGKQPALVSWQTAPSGAVVADFGGALAQAGLEPAHALYFLCRSGVRSHAAALAAEAAGYRTCFNVAEGFEGHPDRQGRRGTTSGWQADGLPWRVEK